MPQASFSTPTLRRVVGLRRLIEDRAVEDCIRRVQTIPAAKHKAELGSSGTLQRGWATSNWKHGYYSAETICGERVLGLRQFELLTRSV